MGETSVTRCSRCDEPAYTGEVFRIGSHGLTLCGDCCDDLLDWIDSTGGTDDNGDTNPFSRVRDGIPGAGSRHEVDDE